MIIKILFTIIGLVAFAYSATMPNSGSILQQEKQQFNSPKLSEDVLKREKKKEPIKKKKESDVKVLVQDFIFEGEITVFTQDELKNITNKYLNKELDVNDLFKILDEIKKAYTKKGYFIAKAFFPRQDITKGVITIVILEGPLESLEINGENLRINQEFVKNVALSSLTLNEPMTKKQLERAILLISDLPGLKATATLEKGLQQGYTKVLFETTEGDLLNPYVSLENSGSRYTGIYKASAGIDFKNLSSYGDELKTKFTKSFGAGDLNLLSLGYEIPLGYSGLKVGLNGNFLNYELGEQFKSLEAKGKSSSYSLYATYPIIRTTKSNLYFKSSWDKTYLSDEQQGNQTDKKSVNTLRTGFFANHSDKILKGGYTYFDLFYHQGKNQIKNIDSYTSDQSTSGANTDGSFKKLSFNLSRIQRGTEKFFITLTTAGQYAYDNLDSSEKFQLGGAYGIRAYPGGEGSGDSGIKASIEGKYILASGTDYGDIRAIGFIDWGRIRQYNDVMSIPMSSPNIYNLSGWGIGLNIGKPNDFDFTITYAQKNGTNPAADPTTGNDSDGSNKDSRVWFSIKKHF